ncbi:MAG TPA: hypothetical protein ENO19_06955, partial [Halothiobacillaceae bacterium]|nr:hypothetical protein [Halothiobacillaceae bacterium]
MEIELFGELTAQDLRRAMALGYSRSFRFSRVVLPIFLTLPVITIVGGGIDALLGADAPVPPIA